MTPELPLAPCPTAPARPAPASEHLLAQLAEAARQCQELEAQFGRHPAPELETIIKLHRVLVLNLSLEAEQAPELLKLVKDLMKPIMDWAQLQEKSRQRELAEKKLEAQNALRARQANPGDAALSPETLEKIEQELNLL